MGDPGQLYSLLRNMAIACGVAAAICSYCMRARAGNPVVRAWLRTAIFLLFGAGMCFFARAEQIDSAPEALRQAEGVVAQLSKSYGRSPRSRFILHAREGDTQGLWSAYVGRNLYEGEPVFARFQAYSGRVVKIMAEGGDFPEWKRTENPNYSIWIFAGLGILLVFVGVFRMVLEMSPKTEPEHPYDQQFYPAEAASKLGPPLDS